MSRKDYKRIAFILRNRYPREINHLPLPTTRLANYLHLRTRVQRRVVEDIALDLAYALKEDNKAFDPIKFLDACSPDPEVYPLSELWDGDNDES